ncbi:c6 finger [Fusarium albosuccineum]|uniref:C6 finger n=1 Tax=Fusarium albosuccineum TaxID=1237068 RepID=A0A8H4NQA9_9HYPO|nr:c6 finger [Fusarium albosuccineum]
MLRWLANISSRRLLNRIHYVLYDTYQGVTINTDSSGAPTSQFGISQELNHQLHAWYDLLPSAIKPDPDHDGHGLDDAILLMRFHAAGDIIHRPFLLQACALSAGEKPDARMVENAKRCLYHCRGYLNAVQGALTKLSASVEIFVHSTMAVVLLLTFASFSPALAPEVGDVKQLQVQAAAIIQSWSFPESSIETMLSIVRTVRVKCLGR